MLIFSIINPMKQILFALFLLANAAPLFANDESGDIAYIPDYRELVREGFGPRERGQYEYLRPALTTTPKPTQAYYGKDQSGKAYTVYYAYTAVPGRAMDTNMLYAFGYPVVFFRQMIPASDTSINLNRYAVVLNNQNGRYGPGDYVAQGRNNRSNATTTAQRATTNTAPANGAAPLPAVGEKPPAH